jgi:hypothetical protein
MFHEQGDKNTSEKKCPCFGRRWTSDDVTLASLCGGEHPRRAPLNTQENELCESRSFSETSASGRLQRSDEACRAGPFRHHRPALLRVNIVRRKDSTQLFAQAQTCPRGRGILPEQRTDANVPSMVARRKRARTIPRHHSGTRPRCTRVVADVAAARRCRHTRHRKTPGDHQEHQGSTETNPRMGADALAAERRCSTPLTPLAQTAKRSGGLPGWRSRSMPTWL